MKDKYSLREEREMDIKEAYRVMQKASGIEVGDTVRVIRRFKEGEMGSPVATCNSKNSAADDRITGEVKSSTNTAINVQCGQSYGGLWHFPFFALEVVEKNKPEKMVDVDGKKISLATVKAALKEYVK